MRGEIRFELRNGRSEVISVSYKDLNYIIEALEKRVEWYDEAIQRTRDDDLRADYGMDAWVMKGICANLTDLKTRIGAG